MWLITLLAVIIFALPGRAQTAVQIQAQIQVVNDQIQLANDQFSIICPGGTSPAVASLNNRLTSLQAQLAAAQTIPIQPVSPAQPVPASQ